MQVMKWRLRIIERRIGDVSEDSLSRRDDEIAGRVSEVD